MTDEKTYVDVVQFYAEHIQLLDEGKADEAVLTFTEDASMVSPPKIPEPIRGRENLLAGLRKAAATLDGEGARIRRCHTMFTVRELPEGRLFVRAYVQVVKTLRGGEPKLHAMCVCEDVLVREGDEFKIHERSVTRDDC